VGRRQRAATSRGPAPQTLLAREAGSPFLAARARVIRSPASAQLSDCSSVAKLLPAVEGGHALRVLDGLWREKRSQLELKAWTEVFAL
jgi:hypothetical protein